MEFGIAHDHACYAVAHLPGALIYRRIKLV